MNERGDRLHLPFALGAGIVAVLVVAGVSVFRHGVSAAFQGGVDRLVLYVGWFVGVTGLVLIVAWGLDQLPTPANRRRQRMAGGCCPRCGFDLHHEFTKQCPECGWFHLRRRGV